MLALGFLLGLVVGLTIAFLTAVLFEIHVKRKSVTVEPRRKPDDR